MTEIKRTLDDQFSGFIIVRLASSLAADGSSSWATLAKRNELEGIATVLNSLDLDGVEPLLSAKSRQQVGNLEAAAALSDFPPLHSLNSYWRIDARRVWDAADQLVVRLNALEEVDTAYKEFAVTDPAVNPSDDDHNHLQDYLDAAKTGVNARWAWRQPDGDGAGVGLVDLEQGWFLRHEDLVAKAPTLIAGDNRDGVNGYKGNHGTAVLGEIVGVDNDRGVVGIAPGVTSVRVVSHYRASDQTALHVADAIIAAIAVMPRGDVLLLEVQRNFLPTEVDDADFIAIRLAVAHGVIVIEAAGNGDNDLDAYTNAGRRILNRADAAFRDSGAIMVGAAQSRLPHDRWQSSNFGSRVDCYGWGENVVTCGYGDLAAGTGDNSKYTKTFGGTSGAAPMVTGCALILQGMRAASGTRLSPGQMRVLLADRATGTPQGPNVAGNIGVMPNLKAIAGNT